MKYEKTYLQLRRQADRVILRHIGLTIAAGAIVGLAAALIGWQS